MSAVKSRRRAAKPRRRAVKLAARHPRQTGRMAWAGTRVAARNPRAVRRSAGLLGRSARGGGKLWAKGRSKKVKARTGARGAKTGVKVLKAARGRRPARSRLVATGALAAAGAYFLDPRRGKNRRDKAGKYLRRGKAGGEGKARHAEGMAHGVAHQAASGQEREPAETRLNDPALARKVETEIFRDADSATRGAVSVNAENGVVYLRGELDDSSRINALVSSAQNVEGVRQVENLLHTPESPAPAKSDGGPGSGAS